MAFQNFFATRLATEIGTSDTTITLETAPSVTSGRLTLEARNPTQREIIEYTNVSGNDITGVTRGACGTTAKTHIQNSLVEMNAVGEDLQDLRDAFDTFLASEGDGWIDPADVPDTVTANGNRSYDLVFNANDLTDTISPGMRLKLTRTATAPTQCADLEASSSQYFNKTSPTGMTFTDDFVVSAWIKVESLGTQQYIASRLNGTSGWGLRIDANGQVCLFGINAGGTNYSWVVSYQSVPIGKWVHVAAQLDMSAFTATTTTSYVMIDGKDVPASVARGGTNPTALVQAGNLEIGATNGGATSFDGKIAQVAIYSAKVTQATVLASMHQTLSGSETSLVSAYSLSNTINDLSANANNLTAQNSAVATATDSPFAGGSVGTTEYAIVTKAAFSTNTTLTVQVPEGYAIPTSGGISAVRYSTHRAPYGFPAQKSKWELFTMLGASATGTAAAGAYVSPGSYGINLTVGDWDLYALLSVQQSNTSAALYAPRVAISTSATDPTDLEMLQSFVQRTSSTSASINQATIYKPLSVTSLTQYYAIVSPEAGAGTISVGLAASRVSDDEYTTLIRAEFNLL